MLNLGTPAPWFIGRTRSSPNFHLHTVGGRIVVLCFFGSAAAPPGARVLADILAHRSVFNDIDASFFGVSTDPGDEQLELTRDLMPGVRFFWDADRSISRLYEAVDHPCTVVLDERLRVAAVLPFSQDPSEHAPLLRKVLRVLLKPDPVHAPVAHAPVLVVPRIFEPGLCATLIRYYEEHGGQESGFMRERDGQTVVVHDYTHKRRRDAPLVEGELVAACKARIHTRLAPEIEKAFQFRATRIERYLVSCYDASTDDHFKPHRDNTTKGTAHRRFAVSLFLNTGEYEGGSLRFPEFGSRLYVAPPGGAVVFSCSLLHEATPVTKGKRYAFLPFLYDEAAALIRKENHKYLGPREDE